MKLGAGPRGGQEMGMVGHRRFEDLSWTMASEDIGPPQLGEHGGVTVFPGRSLCRSCSCHHGLGGRGGREYSLTSTLPVLQLFNTVPHVVVTPSHKVIFIATS